MNTTEAGLPAGQVNAEALEGIAFIGETLGSFFLNDPSSGRIDDALAAIKVLDAEAGAADWPFANKQDALVALTLMQQGLSSVGEGHNGNPLITEDLIWEYRRLFIGPAKKPAPPWGSVYTDWEGVIFGESTLALRQWMRESGIARMSGEGTPEDHIGQMLLLMTWIAKKRPELIEEYLRLHLLTWSSHFLDQLAAAAEHPFYEGMALLTKTSLEGIQMALSIDVVYPRFFR